MKETRNQKFKRLATARTNRAIEKIQLLKNLTSANYVYTEEQVNVMCDFLAKEVGEVRQVLLDELKEDAKNVNIFDFNNSTDV